jgi:hypothetical protein
MTRNLSFQALQALVGQSQVAKILQIVCNKYRIIQIYAIKRISAISIVNLGQPEQRSGTKDANWKNIVQVRCLMQFNVDRGI